MTRTFLHTALIVVLALALAACAPSAKQGKITIKKKKAPSTTRILLDKGEYEEVAKRMSSRRWKKFATKGERAFLYPSAVNGFIARGEKSQAAGEFLKAGTTYRKAISYYPSEDALAKKVKLNRKQLEGNIRACSKELIGAALLKYRAGHLEEAISIWKGILSFDPGHGEAKKALDTATIQLRNLRKLNAK